MNIRTLLAMIAVTALTATASPESQTPPPLPAPPEKVIRDVEYGRADGEPLMLDVHIPSGSAAAKPCPCVILIHGGGWSGGDKAGSDKPGSGADITSLFEPLDHSGLLCFSINYRLAPAHRWPACLEDVRTAIGWVKAHAAEYGGDPARIALMGHSAGGQLALMAAMAGPGCPEVKAVAGIAAVSDLETDTLLRGGLSESLQKLLDRPKEPNSDTIILLRDISPINHVSSSVSPVLLVHGDADKTVPLRQSLALREKLAAAGVHCDLSVIAGGEHRLSKIVDKDPGYPSRMTSWLKEKLEAELPRPTPDTPPAKRVDPE